MKDRTDAFESNQENERKCLDDIVVNSSNAEQQSIIVEDADVRPNDHRILGALNEDRSRYTFRGLMRKLDMHQETLARSLRRLDGLGLIAKSHFGYELSKKGELFSRRHIANTRTEYLPLLQTYIPSNVDAGSIVGSLAGRWFKNLRWLGMVEGETGHLLRWISEDGSFQLNLRIVGSYVIIETNASSEKDKVGAMVSAYRIFEHLSRVYSSQYCDLSSYTFSGEKPAN